MWAFAWEHRGLVSSQTVVWLRTTNSKSVFCQLLFHLARKKSVVENSCLTTFGFRTGFSKDATSGTCVPRRGPWTLVDRGYRRILPPPFSGDFRRSLKQRPRPKQSGLTFRPVVFPEEKFAQTSQFVCCRSVVCMISQLKGGP